MKERLIKAVSRVTPAPLKRAFGRIAAARTAARRTSASFLFRGVEYPYCCETYNMAWCNERAVEVPVIGGLVSREDPERTLEVGNVLSHYHPGRHEVLDKYERGDRVVNEDVISFSPGRDFDLIVSISTLEHVGETGSGTPAKFAEATANLVGLLAPGGLLAVTLPAGQNPEVDSALRAEPSMFDEVFCMVRVGRPNEWEEVPGAKAASTRGAPGLYGAAKVYFCFKRREP